MNFETIPIDLKLAILKYLPLNDLINVFKTSKKHYTLSTYETIWRNVNENLVGDYINISSWMRNVEMESHYEFYKKVLKYANIFNGLHTGSIYPDGKLHRWVLDFNIPKAMGYSVYTRNEFKPSERYLQSLAEMQQDFRYLNVGCTVNNEKNEELTAGLVLNEELTDDLLITFTPNDPLSSIKAFDIENEGLKEIPISIDKLDVKNVVENKDDHLSHPSKHLLPFIDNNENGFVYIVNFGKFYQSWANDQLLSSCKLKSYDNNDNFESIYAFPHVGRGLKLYGGKLFNEDG